MNGERERLEIWATHTRWKDNAAAFGSDIAIVWSLAVSIWPPPTSEIEGFLLVWTQKKVHLFVLRNSRLSL